MNEKSSKRTKRWIIKIDFSWIPIVYSEFLVHVDDTSSNTSELMSLWMPLSNRLTSPQLTTLANWELIDQLYIQWRVSPKSSKSKRQTMHRLKTRFSFTRNSLQIIILQVMNNKIEIKTSRHNLHFLLRWMLK